MKVGEEYSDPFHAIDRPQLRPHERRQAVVLGPNDLNGLGLDSTQSPILPGDVLEPRPVQNAGTYVDLSIGESHQCVLDAAGTAWCWGFNAGGVLGQGTADLLSHPIPAPVSSGHHFVALAAGALHTCALGADSTAWCWGPSTLGDGSSGGSSTPVAVGEGHRFVALSSGGDQSCGLTPGGALWCWGREPLGDGLSHPGGAPLPVRVRDP